MSDPKRPCQDSFIFAEKARRPHRRINPCFMTGKGCVHTEHIDAELDLLDEELTGFNVRPFQPNIETAHRLSLERFLNDYYSGPNHRLHLHEADKVRRTGYVVCEKICRRIQASDFIVVDISAPNANVFYELNLAYGIDQKILVIHQAGCVFGTKAAECLRDGGCPSYAYKDLYPIEPTDFVLSNHTWTRTPLPQQQAALPPTIALITYSYGFLAWAAGDEGRDSDTTATKATKNGERLATQANLLGNILGAKEIELGFETHVKAAVGVAVNNIVENLRKSPPGAIMEKYVDLVKGLKTADQIKRDAGFLDVRQKVEQSFCTIIQTGGL